MTRFRLAILTVIFLSGAVSLQAQGNQQADQVRTLNTNVLQIHAQLQSAGPGAAAGLREQGDALLAQRSAALSALIQQDPAQALQFAFDENLLATLSAAFPQSAPQLESHGVFEGPIEYIILDDHTLARHRVDIRMEVAAQTFFIHFPEHEPDWLECGDILRVVGVKVGTRVAAADGNVTGSVAGAGCTTTGQQNIVAILIQFPGYSLPAGVTTTKVESILFQTDTATSGLRSLNTFWLESSYGNVGATGKAVGPYTLSQVYSCDQYYNMRTAAIAAADADVDFQNYTRLMIVFPPPGSCSWAGLGTLGCSSLSSPGDGGFTASTSWLRSDYMSSNNNGTQLTAHEGGHNLTLHHASTRAFTNSTTGLPEPLGPLGAAGTLNEYGDYFSTMGYWNFGQYNAPHKAKIGWLMGTDQSNGTFSLLPFEVTTGLRALKVQRGTGNNAWLWLEYRQPIGDYDSAIGSQVHGGALVHYHDSTTGTRTHLLDMTPGSSGGFSDPAKHPGTGTFSDPYTNVSFSVDSATSSALGVSVFYGSVPCVEANPTISISPSNPSGQAGSPISYTVTVTNADSSGCDPSEFILSSVVPGGWTTSLAPSLNLAPGASVPTSMTKTAPAGTSAGTYGVQATAQRGTVVVAGNANATIVVPPTLSLQVPAAPVPSRSIVTITATVMSGATPANNASVAFSISHPSGSSYSGSSTTGPDGTASWNYRFKRKDPEGQWTGSATATWNSMTSNPDNQPFSYVTGPATCSQANPTVAISPSSLTGPDGSTVDYSVTVTNNDSSCSAAGFDLASAVPSGWAASFSPAALTLDSGQNGSSTMTVTVPAGASGSNPLTATATNQAYPSFEATGNANYTVGTVEQISVSVLCSPSELVGQIGSNC